MVITGTDSTSLKVIKDLNDGVKIKEIVNTFNISLDQAKKLSRFAKLVNTAKNHLSENEVIKLKEIGLKSLFLSELFKSEDWEGLQDVLASITSTTKRDDFKLLIHSLNEKRVRITEMEERARYQIEALEQRKREGVEKEKELNKVLKEVNETVSEFDKYGDDVKGFLIEHVGLYENGYVLTKRLDSLWQSKLKSDGIIYYDRDDYVHVIFDIDEFVSAYHARVKKRGNILWDKEKERERHDKKMKSSYGGYYEFPESPYYKRGDSLVGESLLQKIEEVKKEIKENRKEIKAAEKEVNKLKKQKVNSFMEAVMRTNQLSPRELKAHGELQSKASKWLFEQDYIATTEVVLPNGKRADVIGYNREGKIYIIEIKASRADFLQDTKWREYLNYCDYFCFIVDYHMSIYGKEGIEDVKIYRFDNKRTKKLIAINNGTVTGTVKDREEIKYLISRSISKKVIYGY